MSQNSISKYVSLLREEAEVYKWFKDNCPLTDVDWQVTFSTEKRRLNQEYVSHYALLATFKSDFQPSKYYYDAASEFALSLGCQTGFSYKNALWDWISKLSDDDRSKACLFLAKTVNNLCFNKNKRFQKNGNGICQVRNWDEYFEDKVTDFSSLPLKQMFFGTESFRENKINLESYYSFAKYACNTSHYSDVYDNWSEDANTSDLISWILLPKDEGDVSIQITPKSYTQVGNATLEKVFEDNWGSEMDTSNVNVNKDVIYFKQNLNGNLSLEKSNLNSQEYFKNITPLEEYALKVQDVSKFTLLDIDISIMLDRSYSMANLSAYFTNPKGEYKNNSVSEKLVFSITEQKSIIVPSADLFQSLSYLKNTGTDRVSLYYDSDEKRLVIKGKDFKLSQTIQDPNWDGKGRIVPTIEREFIVPSFAIIYEQDIDEYTTTAGVEYLEFFNEELTFRDKYDLLNSRIKSPLELPKEFIEDYEFVANSYLQQQSVAVSNISLVEKFKFVENVIDNYLNSYTETYVKYKVSDNITGKWNGKWTEDSDLGIEGSKTIFRKSIESEAWLEPNYVLKVNEAYWTYNKEITTNELLSFFVSKGNDINYRILSLKILGIDYFIFEQSIMDSLVQSGEIFISKINLDQANISATIDYQSREGFVSGNVYSKKNIIMNNSNDENTYSNQLNVFFGSELGITLYDNAAQTIQEAVSDRFIPTLVPQVENEALKKSLELNVDIYNPIFFQGVEKITNSSNIEARMINTVLSTGRNSNTMILETKSGSKSNFDDLGHFALFNNWLRTNRNQILGTFSISEIQDAYIYPTQKHIFVIEHIMPKYKDKDGEVVGFKGDRSRNLKNVVLSADLDTRLVLKELGKIADSSIVTSKEANALVDDFILLYKERFWDARREGRRLFNYFLRKDLTTDSQKTIDFEWNKKYNNYAKPKLEKIPMFPSHSYMFGKRKDASKLVLAEAQKEGIKHVLSRKNSGLFLHEVGFGKTTSSITAVSSMMNTGETSRSLFLVPNSVYDKFQDEIVGNSEAYGLLPNVNIVLLDNLSSTTLMSKSSNNGLGLKVFTEKEKEVMKEFKSFVNNFAMPKKTEKGESPKHLGGQCRIFSSLKRHRVTFENEPDYTATSNWTSAKALIDKAFKASVKSLKNEKVTRHIDVLNDIYLRINTEWNEFSEPILEIISRSNNDPSDTELKSQAKKGLDDLRKQGLRLSVKLSKDINRYMRFANLSLVDDLGYYKPQVLEPNTILVAKHSAAEKQLRPNNAAVMRALMFKNGKGDIIDVPEDLQLSSWADATGYDNNTRLSQEKVKSAVRILETHPISFDKLNVDTIIIDEIHNFNNIVTNAGSFGFANKFDSIGNELRPRDTWMAAGGRRGSSTEYFPLMPMTGNKAGSHAMKYDSKGRGSDSKGSKLTAVAMCFQVQDLKPKVNNVLLLSATPFTDTPFQVLSVLGMSNYDMLMDNGINNGWDFFNNYIDEVYKFDIRHDGGYGLFIDVNGYYNDKALSNLITNVANVKITDEKIEANRPKKAIIPANKMKKSEDGTASTASPQMGDQFEQLEFCNSRVELSDEQKKFQKLIEEYLSDDTAQNKVAEIFPINETRRDTPLTAEEEALLDEELKKMLEARKKEAIEDKDNADLIVEQLEDLYRGSPKYRQHPLLKKYINNIKKTVLGEEPEVDDDDTIDAAADVNQMDNITRLAGKAISCQQAQTSLVLSPYMVNLGDKKYTSKDLKPLGENPSKVFVESSPKLLFVVKSIIQTLEYQQEQLKKGEIEKIGGQVVYFDRHKFEYGNKSYNAFDLLAQYISDNVDLVSSEKDKNGEYIEIAQISGSTKIEDTFKKLPKELKKDKKELTSEEISERKKFRISKGRTSIKDEFNNGDIKILLGSKAIKEGIDLQGNSHTMYICEAEFSPEVAMQLEGRIWRQKNPYDVVRVVYVLAMNTIDSFIYSKINRKVSAIKKMLELGVYEMGTTQFVIDTKEMLIQLESDPDKLTAIQFQDEIKILKEIIDVKEKQITRLEYMKDNFTTISPRYESNLETLSKFYKLFGEANEQGYKNSTILKKLKSQKATEKKADHVASGTKDNIVKWVKSLSDSDLKKYEVTDAELDSAYKVAINEKPALQPFKEWRTKSPLTLESPFSEMQLVAQKVIKNLQLAENVESSWNIMLAEEQEEFRKKANKNKSELLFLVFLDTVGSTDVAKYMRNLNELYSRDVPSINCIKDYQSFVLNNEGIDSIEDAEKVINEQRLEMQSDADKVQNEDKFKADLRASWVKALEERKEVYGGTLEDLVGTMKDSLPLIKIRQK